MERLELFKAELQRAHCPAVMTVAAPEVEAACARNGLSLAEILRPFGIIRQLNGTVGVPVRTPAEHPLRLHSWRLRFYTSDTMFQPAPDAADAHLRRVLSSAAASAASGDVPELQELLNRTARREDPPTPWYQLYRREFLRLMQFGEHETLDHPVACILALPADHAGDLAAAFAALWQHSALPPLMQTGAMESAAVLRQYVLVHDAASQGAEVLAAAKERLRQLGSTLGARCQVLSINSGTGGAPPSGLHLWGDMVHDSVPGGGGGEPAMRSPAPPGGLGAWLSEADVLTLSAFVHELAVRSLLPHMEMRLRALNVQVTANRKGLKNQLKSLLWRKGGTAGGSLDSATPSGTPSSGAVTTDASASYAAGSVESHMRQLSDLALLLGDYETASSTLRLLASDTKADRAYKAYAGVQEALGASAVMAGAPPSEALASYKEAINRYLQLSQSNPRNWEGVRYATRSVLLLTAYLQALGQYSEATAALMRAHFQEDNLRAGLLLEQAAYCLLSLQPAHKRKFAFHLVLAGLRYDMCEQKFLSRRAYTQVLGVYAGHEWALIEEHLHDALGRHARESEDAVGAVRHFMSMLDCPQNNAYCQKLYLAQFMDALRTAQAQLGFALPLELPLPNVDCERVVVQHNGQTCFSGTESRQVPSETWRTLDAALQPGLEAPSSGTWLEGGSRARLTEANDDQRSCCVGEAVGVDVELCNPLQLDLHVSRLRLACSWGPAASSACGTEATRRASIDHCQAGFDSSAGTPTGEGATLQLGFQVHEETVTLQAKERVIVHLRVVPLKPGALHVHGVAWLLNSTAHGQVAFHIRRPLPRTPVSSSKVLIDAGESAAAGGVVFKVLPPMPRLEVSISGLPAAVLAGEIVHCTMWLKNSGAMTLQHLSMAAAGGTHIYLGSGPSSGVGTPAVASTFARAEAARSPGPSEAAKCQQGASLAGDGASVAPSNPNAVAAAACSPSHNKGGNRRSSLGSIAGHLLEPLPAPSFRHDVIVFTLPNVRMSVGQDLALPVWFRMPQTGAAHLTVAWRYEPLVRLDALAYRTVRYAQAVQALPSLHLSSRLAAGVAGSPPGSCMLQAQLHNLSADSMSVVGLACHSSRWQLSRRGGLDGSSCRGLVIASEAAAVLHRVLLPAGDVTAGGDNSDVGERRLLLPSGAFWTAAESAMLNVSRQLAAAAAAAAPKHVPAATHQRQARQQQQASQGVEVVVCWQADARDGADPIRGLCCLHNQTPHTAPAIDARLQGPTSWAHDFHEAALCVLPLTLLLRNTMAASAAVCIEAGRHPHGQAARNGASSWTLLQAQAQAALTADARQAPARSEPAALAATGGLLPAQQHVWCGRTRITLSAVPPGKFVEVPLSVAISRPGKLTLTDCLVSWHVAGQPQVLGSRPVPPHHIVVVQAERSSTAAGVAAPASG